MAVEFLPEPRRMDKKCYIHTQRKQSREPIKLGISLNMHIVVVPCGRVYGDSLPEGLLLKTTVPGCCHSLATSL